ncbi:MAG TPA: DUF1566 domain-containing protein [Candidatus Eisenbacteria bacterium]|nr:DUF1566 domain-containing protein [Candidatus Eisenbacteria bacterium]
MPSRARFLPVWLAVLAAAVSWARLPAACRQCRATCGTAVSACVDAVAAACPSASRAKGRRCRSRALHRCRKTIDTCCKRTCKETGAPVCCGAPATTTTTQPGGGNPCFSDPGDGTIHDSCTGLQWEKKDGSRGAQNPGDPHNLNNVYPWAGTCMRNAGVLCQPDAASATTCAALADGTTAQPPDGCGECPGGDYDPTTNPTGTGPCTVGGSGAQSVTTIWVWLNQLNAANYAGHNDWRIPSQAGRNACPPGEPNCTTAAMPRELETILRAAPGSCSTSPCGYPVFGVPTASQTWSASTSRADARYAWIVNFFAGTNEQLTKQDTAVSVRAVRTEH